jgi:hypothetical protein
MMPALLIVLSLLQPTPADVVRQFFDAYQRLDVDGMTALMAPGMVFEDPTFRLRANDRADWRRQMEPNRQVITSITANVHSMVTAGDQVAVQLTLSGGIKVKDGVRDFKVRCGSFFRVKASLITHWTDYCDYRTFAEQTASPAAAAPYTMSRTDVFDVTSAAGQLYRLSVSLPAAYAGADRRFPVVYVLDGDWYFGLAASTARLLEAVQELPPVIVVAIGYGGSVADQRARRIREFTPEPIETLKDSGHAAEFLGVLQKQLLAAVESRYRTNGERALVGHSLGGLFAAHALVKAPGLFQRVAIGSPALWSSGPPIVTQLSALNAHPRRLFLGLADGDARAIRDSHQSLKRWLATAPAGMQSAAEEFPGMTHQSVIGPLFARALPWMFREQ